eukprot:jgi/Bigna1/89563/estExt_fgenesh1_pg.C_510124
MSIKRHVSRVLVYFFMLHGLSSCCAVAEQQQGEDEMTTTSVKIPSSPSPEEENYGLRSPSDVIMAPLTPPRRAPSAARASLKVPSLTRSSTMTRTQQPYRTPLISPRARSAMKWNERQQHRRTDASNAKEGEQRRGSGRNEREFYEAEEDNTSAQENNATLKMKNKCTGEALDPPPSLESSSRDRRRAIAQQIGRAMQKSRIVTKATIEGKDDDNNNDEDGGGDDGHAKDKDKETRAPSPTMENVNKELFRNTSFYRVLDPRGLAFRTEPRLEARLDRIKSKERGVTWLTQNSVVEASSLPQGGWRFNPTTATTTSISISISSISAFFNTVLFRRYGNSQLEEISRSSSSSSDIIKGVQQQPDHAEGQSPPSSPAEKGQALQSPPNSEASSSSSASSNWLQRVRESALARWRSRFGLQGEPPPARTIWVRHVPFGMSIRKGGLEVVGVQAGSEAFAQGVRRGDRLVGVGGEIIDPSTWRTKFLSLNPPFTILMETAEARPPHHSLLGALRAASPGRTLTATTQSHRRQMQPYLMGFRQMEHHNIASRPLGMRSIAMASPSPEQSDYEAAERMMIMANPISSRRKQPREKNSDKAEASLDEEPKLEDDAISFQVRDAISRLVKSLQSAPNASTEVPDPEGIMVSLLPHQRQALAWMLWRENQTPTGGVLADEMGLGKTMMMISLIVARMRRNAAHIASLPTREARVAELHSRLTNFYRQYNQSMHERHDWIRDVAEGYEGKEEELNIRLMERYQADLKITRTQHMLWKHGLRGPTIVVCPAILIHQWQEEITTRCSLKLLDTYVYYGAQRTKDAKELSRRDIVLTTYETLVRDVMGPFPHPPSSSSSKSKQGGGEDNDDDAEGSSPPPSPLLQVMWDRVVLDEAHMIKNPVSRRARAVCALSARARWAVTGTPLQNEMGELFSLMRFLQYTPFNNSQVWDSCVRNSTQRASNLLRGVMIRRTKRMNGTDGKPLVRLPPRTFTLHRLNLTLIEKAIHDTLNNRSRALFRRYIVQRRRNNNGGGGGMSGSFGDDHGDDGGDGVSYASFLCSLLRMRQACCHPALLREEIDSASVASALAELKISKERGEQGRVTRNDDQQGHDEGPKPSSTATMKASQKSSSKEEDDKTMHGKEDGSDNEDNHRNINEGAGKSSNNSDNRSIKKEQQQNEEDVARYLNPHPQARVLADRSWVSSKLAYTLQLLTDVRTTRPGDKVVIVSQWTSLLKILEIHLQREGWRYVIIDGTVPPNHRKDIISDFNKNPAGAELMLLSMGAGGVGLNLIGGNHLILLDIHWNPAMEAQVCDRVFRVGQKKPVFVHKLLCHGTIEDRVEALQDRKRKLFEAVVTDAQRKQQSGSSAAAQKLTLEDMQMLFS